MTNFFVKVLSKFNKNFKIFIKFFIQFFIQSIVLVETNLNIKIKLPVNKTKVKFDIKLQNKIYNLEFFTNTLLNEFVDGLDILINDVCLDYFYELNLFEVYDKYCEDIEPENINIEYLGIYKASLSESIQYT